MAEAVQRFGGRHTELKLQLLKNYLTAYLRVMRKQSNFRLSYIDALAGTGWSRAGYWEDGRQTALLDQAPPVKGSALRVFEINYKGRCFDRYVFNDRQRSARRLLEKEVFALFPDAELRPQIEFSSKAADEVIARECSRMQVNDRSVMFLDPFGMQVSWKSLELIANSNKIDLWYLAPIGPAYARMMALRGDIPDPRRRRLDEALGGASWQSLYKPLPPDMLGHTGEVRDPGWQAIAAHFMSNWKQVFGRGALSTALPLGHPNRQPYLLCFACSNKSPPAYNAALRIASSLLEGAKGGGLF